MDVLTAHLASTSAYAGFQWAVRLVVYPQLALVPPAALPAYLERYQRRVSYLVGPLFAALLVTTALVVLSGEVPTAVRVLAPLLLAVVLGTTAFAAVPQHRTLSAGWDAAAHRRLLRADTVRVAAATASAVITLLSP